MRKTQNTFLFDFFPKQTTKESKWPNHTNATAWRRIYASKNMQADRKKPPV